MQAQGAWSHEPLFLNLRAAEDLHHTRHLTGKFCLHKVNISCPSFPLHFVRACKKIQHRLYIHSFDLRSDGAPLFFLGLFLYGYWTVCHKTAQDGISSQDWGLGVQRLLFVVNESDDSQYSKILAHGKDIDPSQRETKSDHTSLGLST
jgi:hypothetical protein